MSPAGILETVLYAKNLAATETFYRDVLGLEPFVSVAGRHLFYRCGNQVLLIFNPEATKVPPPPDALPVPPHGAEGPGHVCFRASAAEIDALGIAPAGEGRGRRSRLRMARRRPVDLLPRPRRQLPGVRRTQNLEAHMMRRLQRGTRLVVASHNPGKVREIHDLVAPYGLSAVSAAELDLPEPEETGSTFKANAELKALAAAKSANLPALSDDSGLEVEVLDGAPGIYSARWAGPAKDFKLAMQWVADEVRRARRLDAAGAARQLHGGALPGLARRDVRGL